MRARGGPHGPLARQIHGRLDEWGATREDRSP